MLKVMVNENTSDFRFGMLYFMHRINFFMEVDVCYVDKKAN